MANGTVKWFSNSKGYGFISPESGGDDVFAHFSAIEMDGYKTLKQGQEVEFELKEGPKGPQAASIHAAEASEASTPDSAPDSVIADSAAPETETSQQAT